MTRRPAAVRRAVAAMAVAAIAWGVPIAADEADRSAYLATLNREHAVRATFNGTPAPEVALKDVHSIVSAYETLVRRFPASGYSDDALWNAGRLELDAFARFGQPLDREQGIKLLRRLKAGYPTSRLAKRVPETLATLDSASKTPVATVARSTIATIRSVKRTVLPDVVRVVIELDGEVPFRDDRATDPDRVLID